MTTSELTVPAVARSAAELRRLAPAERNAALRAAAEAARADYLTDRELTAFEAFGEEDLYVHNSVAHTG